MKKKPNAYALQTIIAGAILLTFIPSCRAQILSDLPYFPESPTRSAMEVPQTSSSPAAPERDESPAQTDTASSKPRSTAAPRFAGSTCDLLSDPVRCFGDVLRDQPGIWTAPARLRGRKLLWLAPFAAATTLAFVYDVRLMNELGSSPTRIRAGNDVAHLGAGYVLVPAAALTYVIGRLDHKERVRETGMLALEALADGTIVMEVIKLATNRQRPFVAPGTGKFWPDDTDVYSFSSSFPSGHAIASWAFARVIVEETPGHPWLHVALYGFATTVALARVAAQQHFPSDVLVGSVFGYAIGGYVYHHRSAFYETKAKSVRIGPLYNPATASYGLSVSLRP